MRRTPLSVVVLALAVAGAGSAYLIFAPPSGGSGSGGEASAAAMCAEHEIAEKDCPWCNPSLIEEKGQCPGHGVPEALCSRCHPALIPGFRAEGDWCDGHGVPESQCTICRSGSGAEPESGEPASTSATAVELIPAPEMPRTRRAPRVTCRTSTLRIRLASPETAEKAGFQYARVERRSVTETVACNAEVVYDGNRYARLSSRAPGVVQDVAVDLGQSVERGEVLAVIDSADLGTAKAEYLQARARVRLWEKNHAREQRLLEKSVSSEREVLEAETKLSESRIALSQATQRLRNLGLPEDRIAKVAEEQETSSALSLTAPFAATVVERSAVAGEVVGTTEPLFAIADTSRMWAMLDVYESDVRKVRLGQDAILEVEGLAGEQHGGIVTWVSSHVDRRTRTLEVRAEIPNPEGVLRAGMFGEALIRVRDRDPAPVVPETAVQWEGCCNVVFVRKSGVLFEPRKVRLGYETDRHFVVDEGLREGETVVTTGSYLLKTEILKDSIGAGCCEVDPGAE